MRSRPKALAFQARSRWASTRKGGTGKVYNGERAGPRPPSLPEAPGVYLWKRGEEVLYVGKAKSLRARVKSYFHAEGKAGRIAEEATALDFIATRDEVEALLLEANLIKAHRPPYNVLLKDDKHYPFLKLTNEPSPPFWWCGGWRRTGPSTTGPSPRRGP